MLKQNETTEIMRIRKQIVTLRQENEKKLKYSLKILDNEQNAKNQDCQRNRIFRYLLRCLQHN